MISETNKRIMITLSKELDSKITHYSKSMGLTKGQLIVSLVGQHVMNMEKGYEILGEMVTKMGGELAQQIKEEN